jgi:NTP pyrophosphatase (non-canonical NTP hydrolase)
MKYVHQWRSRTFSCHDLVAMTEHLAEEATELGDEVSTHLAFADSVSFKNCQMEIADCLVLTLDIATRLGMSSEDVVLAVIQKIMVNEKRSWAINEHGKLRHVKEAGE